MQTTQADPIIAEIHAIRDEYAARFGHGVGRMFRDLQARQTVSHRQYVCLSAHRPSTEFNVPGQGDHSGTATDQPPTQGLDSQ